MGIKLDNLEKRVRIQGNLIDTLISMVNKLDEEVAKIKKEIEEIKKVKK